MKTLSNEKIEKEQFPTISSSDLSCGYTPGSPECKECPALRRCPKRDMIELAEMFAQIAKCVRSGRR